MSARRVQVIDSHTGGEPTRVVLAGGPDLAGGSVAKQLAAFRARHDDFRRAVTLEPRGSDVLVGALVVPPADPACAAGVIFFDNAGFLGMCGHGSIGLVATLAHLGRLTPGEHRLETAVGVVTATLHADASVSIANVPSYRHAKDVAAGSFIGDVAYGGNWFFIAREHGQAVERARVEALTDFAWRARLAVNAAGFPEVDHVIVPDAARHFVLCPGRAYDRSPCGTGTSARLACLAADGRLAEDEPWRQESLIGSVFHGRYRWIDRARGVIAPTITGRAFVTAETTLLFHPADPYCSGIPPAL